MSQNASTLKDSISNNPDRLDPTFPSIRSTATIRNDWDVKTPRNRYNWYVTLRLCFGHFSECCKGGGIIGCTTAYYLSRHPNFPSSNSTITLIEASTKGPAQGASGKAGGLVAKWAYPKELVEVSFEEHVKLATEHNGTDRWGWRYVSMGSWEGRGEVYSDSTGGSAVGKGGKRKSLEKTLGLEEGGRSRKTDRKDKGLPEDLWVKEELTDSYSSMAPEGATAQVHPYLFTTSMLQLAKENGVIFKAGKVTTITSDSGRVIGIEYLDPTTKETREVSATDVVLCAGAWSPRILSSLPISATRAHSITIRVPPSSKIAPYVLFTEITQPSGFSHGGRIVTPEIYARPGNEVYGKRRSFMLTQHG